MAEAAASSPLSEATLRPPTSESPSGIPLLEPSEVVVDRELGSGGFCTVWSVRRFEVAAGPPDAPPPLADDPDVADGDPLREREEARRRFDRRFAGYERFSRQAPPGRPRPAIDPAGRGPPRVAIKRVRPGLGPERRAAAVRDLTTEVNILAACSHPNIVPIYAAGRDDGGGAIFAVIGQLRATLKNWMHKWRQERGMGILITQEALDRLWMERMLAIKAVAEAVRYLHSRGIVHRDINPENVGFDQDDVVKLFDFGLAKCLYNTGKTEYIDGKAEDESSLDDRGSHQRPVREDLFDLTGQTGTPRYTAPEVALGCPYGLKCDVYSLAILTHEVLSLLKPFAGVAPSAFNSVVMKGGLRPALDTSWPRGLRDHLRRMWASDCARRPTAERFVEALDDMLRGPDNELYPRSWGMRFFSTEEEPPNRDGGA